MIIWTRSVQWWGKYVQVELKVDKVGRPGPAGVLGKNFGESNQHLSTEDVCCGDNLGQRWSDV
jgi:hypothetical protein